MENKKKYEEKNEEILVESIVLNRRSLSLGKNSSYIVRANTAPSKVENEQLSWHSSNPSVATVDGDGKIRAVGYGTAEITASKADGTCESVPCYITVPEAPNP